MRITPTAAPGLCTITLDIFPDSRGLFFEGFHHKKWATHLGSPFHIQQINYSRSQKGTLRGLHFQKPPHAQAKCLLVLEGAIFDVAVDLRTGSPSYGRFFSFDLHAHTPTCVFLPKGFAHGFLVRSASTLIGYAQDEVYHPEHEGGIHYKDPALQIPWPLEDKNPILSDKDQQWGTLEDTHHLFTFS